MKKRVLAILVLAMVLLCQLPAMADPAQDMVVAGSCSTSLKGSSGNRIQNVTVGAAHVNGLVLEPGAVVSISALLGPRDAAHGYALAGVYSGGKTVPGYGGGICQVSSTVYNAAMNAGLKVIQRYPHSMPVSYLPLGQDAAISWGSKDLVIQNPYDTPVTFAAAVDGLTLNAAVFVSNATLAGKSYRFYSVKTSGLSAVTYRDCYINGILAGTEVVANSAYAPHS